MQKKLLPDLEQHTLMLADSHNIFLKLKNNGTLSDISSLFKKIYQTEIDFAAKELKRISNELDCNIDLESELMNNSEIFRANLKEIVGKVIDIIWESGKESIPSKKISQPKNNLISQNIVDNIFQEEISEEKDKHISEKKQKETFDKRNHKFNDEEDINNQPNEFQKTYEFGSDLYSYGNNTQGFGTQEIEELKKASLLDKTQELQNLKKKNLESKFLSQKPFFIQIF
jgi:hypothetical protein